MTYNIKHDRSIITQAFILRSLKKDEVGSIGVGSAEVAQASISQ